jgi:ABC-type nitrate/sulfonate/bicarbonate transport system substrate-binding protein
MGDATAVIAIARGLPVRLLTSHGGGEHRHRIVVNADSGILEAAQLAGRRVAVKKGTSTFGGLLGFLEGHEIEPADLQLIDMRPADMPEALASRSVDAIVASEPTPSLCEAGGGRALGTLGNLGSTYPILLVASEAFAASSADRVEGLLRSLERAAELIRTRPDEAAGIVAQETGLSRATATRAMGFHTYRLGLDDSTTASLASIARFLMDQGVISHLPDIRQPVAPGPPELPAAAAAEG